MTALAAFEPETALLTAVRAAAGQGVAVVAFSGGADSAAVLAAAARALGRERVIAVTAVSPSLADDELRAAQRFAELLGVRHLTPRSHELQRPGYAANSPSRCFHCKTEVMAVVNEAARAALPTGTTFVIMTGTNADDLRDPHRPGIAAAAQAGAATPLAGLTKQEIRAVSREWKLPTHDKPAQACLASRLAYGVPVSAEALGRVQRAERLLREHFDARGWPIANLRVRDLGDDAARIEVDSDHAAEVAADADCVDRVIGAGFRHAFVDAAGFRSGRMNDGVAPSMPTPAPADSHPARR